MSCIDPPCPTKTLKPCRDLDPSDPSPSPRTDPPTGESFPLSVKPFVPPTCPSATSHHQPCRKVALGGCGGCGQTKANRQRSRADQGQRRGGVGSKVRCLFLTSATGTRDGVHVILPGDCEVPGTPSILGTQERHHETLCARRQLPSVASSQMCLSDSGAQDTPASSRCSFAEKWEPCPGPQTAPHRAKVCPRCEGHPAAPPGEDPFPCSSQTPGETRTINHLFPGGLSTHLPGNRGLHRQEGPEPCPFDPECSGLEKSHIQDLKV